MSINRFLCVLERERLIYFETVGTGCCNFTVDGNSNLGNSGANKTYCLMGTTDTGRADAADTAPTIDNHDIIIFMKKRKLIKI